ncbi:MAG: hypothetical protein KF866_03400 [Phycisphaeraceae bacterium]|nr:hypothetical protein [Phycisphaeraceae bacterium]
MGHVFDGPERVLNRFRLEPLDELKKGEAVLCGEGDCVELGGGEEIGEYEMYFVWVHAVSMDYDR